MEQHANKESNLNDLKVKEAVNSEREITVNVAAYSTQQDLEALKNYALQHYTQSRTELYKAIAKSFIWYHCAVTNKGYLEIAFEGFTNRSPNAKYLNTIKFCLGLGEANRESTATKYAKVLWFIEEQLSEPVDLSNTDYLVEVIIKLIRNAGGLDKCASNQSIYTTKPPSGTAKAIINAEAAGKVHNQVNTTEPAANDELINTNSACSQQPATEQNKLAESDSADSKKPLLPKMSEEYLNSQMRQYADRDAIAKFNYQGEASDTKLVLMVGRVNQSSVEVVDIASNDELLKQYIKYSVKSQATNASEGV